MRESAAQRAEQIFELYKRGATYAQAGAAVGMTKVAARRAVLRIMRGVPASDVREQRNLMAERYQMGRHKLWEIIDSQTSTTEQKLAAIGHWLRLENQHAEIYGLKKLVVKVHDESNALSVDWARHLLARYHETLENQKEVIVEKSAERIEENGAEAQSAGDASATSTDAETADDESDAIEVLPGAPIDFTKKRTGRMNMAGLRRRDARKRRAGRRGRRATARGQNLTSSHRCSLRDRVLPRFGACVMQDVGRLHEMLAALDEAR
jgi:hypothetical protein